jgi:excisionase family DNA binding protein
MTVGEVAEELKLKPSQVYNLIKRSELPAHRITERTIRVNRGELYAWLETRKNMPERLEGG